MVQRQLFLYTLNECIPCTHAHVATGILIISVHKSHHTDESIVVS